MKVGCIVKTHHGFLISPFGGADKELAKDLDEAFAGAATPGTTELPDPSASAVPEEPEIIPDVSNVPPPEISRSAVDKRLRRLMALNSKGESKLPSEIRDQWADKYGREKVLALFEKAGYDPDRASKKHICFERFGQVV